MRSALARLRRGRTFVEGAILIALAAAACSDEAPRARVDDGAELSVVRERPSTTLAATLPAKRAPDSTACAPNMVLVEGLYCPEVVHRCKRWMDPEGRYRHFRCAEYERPASCRSPKKAMRFCMDRDEFVAKGESLPQNYQSLTAAARTCGVQGKRVCRESEYNFACEGEEMRPYPYGFARDASACNADRTDLFGAGGLGCVLE